MNAQQARSLTFQADVQSLEDDRHENEYDDAAAEAYELEMDTRKEDFLIVRCPFFNAPYCMAHDYDHVYERREEQDEFNARWAEMKNEFGRFEAAQEAAAFMRDAESW